MGCLFVLIAALSPRLAVVLMWIFTPWGRSRLRPDHLADPGHHLPPADDAYVRDLLEHGAGVESPAGNGSS
jgi:hypothetical protein